MVSSRFNLGVIDNRLLARSIGYLEPVPAVMVKTGTPVKDVLECLIDNLVGCVTIVDKDGRLIGIFSDRDVLLRLVLNRVDIEREPIDHYMTIHPETSQITSPVAYVLSMMSQGGYRHVPIVDEAERPVAMISVKDVVDYIVAEMEKEISRLCEESLSLVS